MTRVTGYTRVKVIVGRADRRVASRRATPRHAAPGRANPQIDCAMPKRIAGPEKPRARARCVLIVEVYFESIFDDPLIGPTVSPLPFYSRVLFSRLLFFPLVFLSFSLSLLQNSSTALAKQLNRNVGRRGNVRIKYTRSHSPVEWSGKRSERSGGR